MSVKIKQRASFVKNILNNWRHSSTCNAVIYSRSYEIKRARSWYKKTTKSGLQYKVIKEGTGAVPKATDTVKTHYTGTLVNGDKFDSSVDRGEPAVFGVTQVIPGWTEALQMMKVGSKWQLAIPAALAYGEQGPGGKIGPNCTLLFDVELLGIEKPN